MRCSVLFFKQKTAYELRISDWSSDVCSSDLRAALAAGLVAGALVMLGPAEIGQHRFPGPAAVAELRPGVVVERLARSAERSVGKECVSPCRSRWSADP